MHSGKVFAKTEKLALTKIVKLFTEAHDCAFTVCFRTKLDEKHVKDELQKLNEGLLKDEKRLKAFAKEVIQGQEMTITGRYYKHETKLGRSLIIDLEQPWGRGFRLVDHRTLQYLIIKNVKYIVS